MHVNVALSYYRSFLFIHGSFLSARATCSTMVVRAALFKSGVGADLCGHIGPVALAHVLHGMLYALPKSIRNHPRVAFPLQ